MKQATVSQTVLEQNVCMSTWASLSNSKKLKFKLENRLTSSPIKVSFFHKKSIFVSELHDHVSTKNERYVCVV